MAGASPELQADGVSVGLRRGLAGPRCAHALTVVAPTKNHGHRLILFGGATAIEGCASGIRLDGVTNSVHAYDVETKKRTRIRPVGEPPSLRAAHAAAAVGTMVVFQGGIGPAGHSTDDLCVLDLTNDKYKWHRLVVQGDGPGPLYGHAMDLVAQCYLVSVSGNDGGDHFSIYSTEHQVSISIASLENPKIFCSLNS